jgi:hypothetical protein
MGVDVMRSAFNLEPKYRVNMLTREDWTEGTGAPPSVEGLVWSTNGSKTKERTGVGVYGQSVGKRPQLFHRKICYSLSGRDICHLYMCL